VQHAEHWQALQQGQGQEERPAAGAPGSEAGGSERGGGGGTHLSFAIPQRQADLPSLFTALERGR
jgi:hypothetical protein